jgi:hypothetical protein
VTAGEVIGQFSQTATGRCASFCRSRLPPVAAEVSAESVFDLYRQEIELANAIITVTPPDAPPAWWPASLSGSWRMDDLQQVIICVITETACHAGHLDAVRELLDGRKWLVLTD